HEQEIFSTPDQLEAHIRANHQGKFTENQIPLIIKTSRRAIEDPFIQLAVSYEGEQYDPGNGHLCLLCRDFTESPVGHGKDGLDNSNQSGIYFHILDHLEELALLSLPEVYDEAESNTSQNL